MNWDTIRRTVGIKRTGQSVVREQKGLRARGRGILGRPVVWCLAPAIAAVCALPAVGQFPPPGLGTPPAGSGMTGQDWWGRTPTVRSKYYNIKTDLAPDDAKIMAEHMDATFGAYWGLFSRLPVRLQRPATLDLYMFANQQDYVNVLAGRFHDDATGSWGKCITAGKSISLVGWKGHHSLEDFKQLFQHEGFHQLSSHLFSGTPLWAEEGMAELFERGVAVGSQLVVGDFPPRDKAVLVRAIEAAQIIPFEQFLAITPQQWDTRVRTGDAQLQYLQAWSLIHFLVFAEEGKFETSYLNFLVQLNRRVPWQRAFVASFGVPDVKALEAQWSQYVRAAHPTDYRETLCRLDFLAAGMAALAAEEIYPTSIEELKGHLQKKAFEHRSNMPGEPRQMSAQDSQLFEVPFAEGIAERRFELLEPRGGGNRGRQEPSPRTIVALGLYPQVFFAEWTRRGREAGYVLSAQPSAQYEKNRPKPSANERRTERGPTTGDSADTAASSSEPVQSDTGPRTWTSADGKFTTVAELVGYKDGVAQLRRNDGVVIRVRREQLSPADQQFLDRQERRTP